MGDLAGAAATRRLLVGAEGAASGVALAGRGSSTSAPGAVGAVAVALVFRGGRRARLERHRAPSALRRDRRYIGAGRVGRRSGLDARAQARPMTLAGARDG